MSEILSVSNLMKNYGSVQALNGVSCGFKREKFMDCLGLMPAEKILS